ncbi:hypothetical protein V501_03863 [Pseudogymnoascus sp. VKM F-4519 (FW-2642)]|nr:hypothetical protein V501_03863 [Pseudogymnoascus sp. VKM F-4519 (FW-2642)]
MQHYVTSRDNIAHGSPPSSHIHPPPFSPAHLDDEVPATSTEHSLKMSNNQEYDGDATEQATYESDNDDNNYQPTPAQPQKSLQRQQQQQQVPNGAPANNQLTRDQIRENMGYRAPVIRESRIKDRPAKKDEKDSAVKIKIELDLEVEVDLYARVKGDVTIGESFNHHRHNFVHHITPATFLAQLASVALDFITSPPVVSIRPDSVRMGAPHVSVATISTCSTLVDYVQFKKWELTDCFSDVEQFQVSPSYAMGIIFNRPKGGYKNSRGITKKLSDIAPSFFLTCDKVRLECFNFGHGIVYDGCWVTYDDKIMCGSSMQKLPTGQSFSVLCEDRIFRKWFTKVLNGAYKEYDYDFDTLPPEFLKSLTSPKLPGSLASENPAGSRPSTGPSIPNNQVAATAQQSGLGISLHLGQSRERQVAAPGQQGAIASTSLASAGSLYSLAIAQAQATAKAKADAHLSNSSTVQAVSVQAVAPTNLGSTLNHSSNQSAARDKADKTAPVQDGSPAAGHAARQNDSSPTSYAGKRTKTRAPYRRIERIDLCSDDEEDVQSEPEDSQPSSNAAQNQELMKEIASLKLSVSRAVERANEAIDKIEKLMQENTNLKLSEMRAVNRADEALGKLRAANRANEELGGNDGLDGEITGGIKNEGGTQQIKKEDHTRQQKE